MKTGLISVALPGPWWTELTYEASEPPPAGTRVRVPIGSAVRVAIVTCGIDSVPDGYTGEIRKIVEAIDKSPLLGEPTMRLLQWFAQTHLCGLGTAMKTLLPEYFLRGEPPDLGRKGRNLAAVEWSETPNAGDPRGVDFVYEPGDAARHEIYAHLLCDGAPSLVAFPQYGEAKRFYEFLTGYHDFAGLLDRVTLFPHSGAKSEWQAWCRLAAGLPRGAIVVGTQIAALAPIPGLARVIIEDESNNVWRTMRRPVFNARSLLSKRAIDEGASLILGGRMPSSRAYLRLKEAGKQPAPARRKIFYVDIRDAYSPQVGGVSDALAVSEPLVRETESALARGHWAIWILDRRGYAGEIVCDECGASMRCPKCGGAMRWEGATRGAGCLRCVVCGASGTMPERCPECRGVLLTARRPGLEALLPLARSAIGTSPVYSMESGGLPEEAADSHAGLVIGTRAALELCDKLTVGLVGWIDPDGESRGAGHDARTRAFSLIWESCWRGREPDNRRVLLQSRRPGKDWQKGLDDGWRIFWRDEMRERKEFGLPPFIPLVAIDLAAPDIGVLRGRLDRGGIEYWEAEDEGRERRIWARTKKIAALREALAPLYGIDRSRRGYPNVTVWYD